MSRPYSDAAWKVKVKSSHQKLILLALADAANGVGRCWPSTRFLALRCYMSRFGVQVVIKQLEALKIIIVRRVKGRNSNVYTLTFATALIGAQPELDIDQIPEKRFNQRPTRLAVEGQTQRPTRLASQANTVGSNGQPGWHRSGKEPVMNQGRPRQLSVMDLKDIKEAKEQKASELKNKFCSEVATGNTWSSQRAREEYVTLRKSARELNDRISNFAP